MRRSTRQFYPLHQQIKLHVLVVLLEAVEILDEAEAVKMAVVEVAATTTGHPVKSIRGQTRMHQGVIIGLSYQPQNHIAVLLHIKLTCMLIQELCIT
jgi:hypothetical protein